MSNDNISKYISKKCSKIIYEGNFPLSIKIKKQYHKITYNSII